MQTVGPARAHSAKERTQGNELHKEVGGEGIRAHGEGLKRFVKEKAC